MPRHMIKLLKMKDKEKKRERNNTLSIVENNLHDNWNSHEKPWRSGENGIIFVKC